MQRPSEFTAGFRAAISQGATLAGLTYNDSDEAARRFAVYRNNVAHSLSQALARRFPVIQRLVGDAFFSAMAREFIAAHPPRSPVIHEWGANFPEFLAGFPPVASLPYLADVARIEWLRGCSYHAADAVPLDPESLMEAAPFVLHPSVFVQSLQHPAVTIWQANQPGSDGRVTISGAETALIWRRTDFSVGVIAIGTDDATFISLLRDTASLEKAAAEYDPVRMLAFLLREQLICEGNQ